MGLFGLFGRKKEVELDKVKDDNKEKFLREPGDNNTEGILQFENLNFKLAVIQVLMYDLNLLSESARCIVSNYIYMDIIYDKLRS